MCVSVCLCNGYAYHIYTYRLHFTYIYGCVKASIYTYIHICKSKPKNILQFTQMAIGDARS